MTHTQRKIYNHKQQQVFRYVMLLVVVSILTSIFGAYNMYSSSRTVYAVRNIQKETHQIEQEIANAESYFYNQTKDITLQSAQERMVAYSPSSNELRYAQVGGAVYSLLRK